MSETEHTWTAEESHRVVKPTWVITYNPTPGGKKNADGSTSYSLIFPALALTEFVSEPATIAAKIAAKLNAHDVLVEALTELLAANDAVQLALCNGPDVPGWDRTELPRAQQRQDEAETAARAALGAK